MSDTRSALRQARESIGFSREMVVRRRELEPPITTKTLERWEAAPEKVKTFRLMQLSGIYGVPIAQLRNGKRLS